MEAGFLLYVRSSAGRKLARHRATRAAHSRGVLTGNKHVFMARCGFGVTVPSAFVVIWEGEATF